MENNKGTICVQGGWQPKKGEPRVLPIYQSTTFKYDTSDQMGRLFDLEDSGYFYTKPKGLWEPSYRVLNSPSLPGSVSESSGSPARILWLRLFFTRQQ